jgi:hypothetical protein
MEKIMLLESVFQKNKPSSNNPAQNVAYVLEETFNSIDQYGAASSKTTSYYFITWAVIGTGLAFSFTTYFLKHFNWLTIPVDIFFGSLGGFIIGLLFAIMFDGKDERLSRIFPNFKHAQNKKNQLVNKLTSLCSELAFQHAILLEFQNILSHYEKINYTGISEINTLRELHNDLKKFFSRGQFKEASDLLISRQNFFQSIKQSLITYNLENTSLTQYTQQLNSFAQEKGLPAIVSYDQKEELLIEKEISYQQML